MTIGEYRRATRCGLGRRLRRCRKPLLGQCQYCARGFCRDHGEQFGASEEVCQRAECQAKKHDMVAHQRFRRAALERNGNALCGQPDCADPPAGDCQRCDARYCVPHLRRQLIEVMRGIEREPQMLSLCLHCVERMPIWKRE